MRLGIIIISLVLYSSQLLAQTQNEKNEPVNQNVNNSQNPESNNFKNKQEQKVSASESAVDDVAKPGAMQTKIPVPQPESPKSWQSYYSSIQQSAVKNYDKQPTAAQQKQMDDILSEMESYHGQSYEFNVMQYINSQQNRNFGSHLLTAYKMDPSRADALPYVAGYAEMTQNTSLKTEVLQKMAAGGIFGNVVLQYHRDLLNSLPANAVLLTNGKDDTYPLWILQQKENLKPGVQIIYLDLMHDEMYRKTIAGKLGISEIKGNETDEYITAILNNYKGSLYLPATLRKDVLKKLSDHSLTLTGIVFSKTSSEAVANATLKKFWEEQADTGKMENLWGTTGENQYKRNYLPALVKLYGIYKIDGNDKEAAKVKSTALTIASKTGTLASVEKYFKP
jgi:hypothetical protein